MLKVRLRSLFRLYDKAGIFLIAHGLPGKSTQKNWEDISVYQQRNSAYLSKSEYLCFCKYERYHEYRITLAEIKCKDTNLILARGPSIKYVWYIGDHAKTYNCVEGGGALFLKKVGKIAKFIVQTIVRFENKRKIVERGGHFQKLCT